MSDTLRNIVTTPEKRPALVDGCVELVEKEVSGKGLIIRGAFKAVKKIKPGFVKGAVDGLLNDWLDKMEPFYSEWKGKSEGKLSEYLNSKSGEVADALLTVTDERAKTSKHKTAAKMYGKLRPSALKNVDAAIPGLSTLIETYL